MRPTLATLFLAAALAAAPGSPDFAPKDNSGLDGEYQLVLREALFQGDEPGPIRPNLVLELACDRGVWRTVTGMALRYNQGDHFGIVEDANAGGGELRLKLVVTIGSDVWVAGGIAHYHVNIRRAVDGTIDGTYTGTFKDRPLSGKVFGEFRPPRKVRLKGYRPLDPTEHPRLLLRKHELPALREKLKTPLGRAYLAAAQAGPDDMVSLGMLYQLTGEQSCADRARALLEAMKGDFGPDAGGAGSGGVGHKFVQVALAYDLCYDAWPAEFRDAIAARMMRFITYYQKVLPIAYANYHPCSNYYGPGRGSMAIGSLALYGDKGPEPQNPTSSDEMVKAGGFQALLLKQSGETAGIERKYREALARWKTEHHAWEESGGGDRAKLHAFHAGRMHMLRHYRLGVGDGGFQAETGGYAGIATRYPHLYANLYFHMFGKDASPYDDINLLMVRKMMQQVFLDEGKQRTRSQKLSTSADFRLDWIAVGFPTAPERYRPGMLWAWNHLAGVKGPLTTDAVITSLAKASGLDLAMAFIHYPLEVTPVHPSEYMPLTWQAGSFGFYLFRDGWGGKDDFIAQVFLKAQPVGGWNHPNAGTFRLMGLGHFWNTGPDSRNGVREQEDVVLLPDDKVRNDCARLTHLQFAEDGSGVLTMDMGDLYCGRKTVKVLSKETVKQVPGGGTIKVGGEMVDRELPLRDGHGFRMADHWADSGLTGLRSIAVDYSGRSGAPCLMAVADRITRGGRKIWMWQVPVPEGRGGEAPKVSASGNTFTISYGDAFLKGTVASPAGAKAEHRAERVEIGEARHGFHGDVNRILVTGADPKAGDFLVVVTVQRKDAPAVAVEGTGLGATVTVGGQRLHFDGERIVVGP